MNYEIETTKSPESRFLGYSTGVKTLAAIAESVGIAKEEDQVERSQQETAEQNNGGSI